MNYLVFVRKFLANLILELINLGIYEISVDDIMKIKSELARQFENKEICAFLTPSSIENFANKYYSFLHFDCNKKMLKITNCALADMYLSAIYKTKNGSFSRHLEQAIKKVLNIENLEI